MQPRLLTESKVQRAKSSALPSRHLENGLAHPNARQAQPQPSPEVCFGCGEKIVIEGFPALGSEANCPASRKLVAAKYVRSINAAQIAATLVIAASSNADGHLPVIRGAEALQKLYWGLSKALLKPCQGITELKVLLIYTGALSVQGTQAHVQHVRLMPNSSYDAQGCLNSKQSLSASEVRRYQGG